MKIKHYSYILFVAFIFSFQNGKAQHQQVITQYMFHGLVLNPAYAGTTGGFTTTLINKGIPFTAHNISSFQSLFVQSPLYKNRIGVGAMFNRSNLSIHNIYEILGMYAYKIRIPKGILSFGMQTGIIYGNSNYTELIAKDINDPVIQNTYALKPNFGLGIYYYNDNFYAGISVPYILKNSTFNLTNTALIADDPRYYYFTSGIVTPIHRYIKIHPSALLFLAEGNTFGYNLNFMFIVDDFIYFGTSYKSSNSISLITQLNLGDAIVAGYSYDFYFDKLSSFIKSNHELVIKYKLNLSVYKQYKRYDPRHF
ncbi:MAG: PorP/SprF family type IX secretion system membrane protein [Chitinophagaceae bacterium]|nr:PorP/SprF family type IX secretion system membrane protein [Chitinophagaceae bacterium]